MDKLLREKEGIFLWCLEGLHRLIGNNYQFSISGKARENMETVKRSSNNVIEFLQSEGYIRFRADSEASSKAIYEAYTRWCDDNAQKPMSANRVSSELAQNERLYNVEATNNVHVGGKRVRGFRRVKAIKPELERYTGLVQQIKAKSKECKNLLAEKKETPFYQIPKLHDLSRRIAELTEELEELNTEKEMLLRSLDCADDT